MSTQSTQKSIKFTKIIGASLITLTTLIALSSTAWAGQPTVTIGYENNGADPYMVTQARGEFQKMIPGHVHLKFFASGPAAMSALASNSLQFMCGLGVPPFVEAISHGLPLTIIYNQERYSTGAGIVVRPGSGIKTIADLKGKKIAIVVGSQSSFELATFLAAAHVPYSSVKQVNMSPQDMLIAWRTKDIDAAIVWDPVLNSLQALGARVLKTDADLPATATSYNICVADTHWVNAHPQIATDFVRALNEGVAYTKAHPHKALALMAKASGVTLPIAKTELSGYTIFGGKAQLTPNVLGTTSSATPSATEQTVVNTAKVLLKSGQIDAMPHNPAASVDPQFAAAAAK